MLGLISVAIFDESLREPGWTEEERRQEKTGDTITAHLSLVSEKSRNFVLLFNFTASVNHQLV